MASPFDFSSGAVLTAAQLNEIGDTKSWVPTWTNLTIGNASVTALYNVVNNLCFYFVKVAFGSTTSVTSSVSLSTPVNNSLHSYQNGNVWLRPTGGTIYPSQVTVISNRIYIYASFPVSAGGYVRSANMTPTIPATWNTSGQIYLNGMYQIS